MSTVEFVLVHMCGLCTNRQLITLSVQYIAATCTQSYHTVELQEWTPGIWPWNMTPNIFTDTRCHQVTIQTQSLHGSDDMYEHMSLPTWWDEILEQRLCVVRYLMCVISLEQMREHNYGIQYLSVIVQLNLVSWPSSYVDYLSRSIYTLQKSRYPPGNHCANHF